MLGRRVNCFFFSRLCCFLCVDVGWPIPRWSDLPHAEGVDNGARFSPPPPVDSSRSRHSTNVLRIGLHWPLDTRTAVNHERSELQGGPLHRGDGKTKIYPSLPRRVDSYGHTFAQRTQRTNGAGQGQGHQAGTGGSSHCPSAWLSLSTSRRESAGKARFGVRRQEKGDLRARLFLAPTSGLCEMSNAEVPAGVLEAEAGRESQTGSAEPAQAQKRRLAHPSNLGVPTCR